jgi:hypothetical protein
MGFGHSIVLFLIVSVVGHKRSGRGGVHFKANTLAVKYRPFGHNLRTLAH